LNTQGKIYLRSKKSERRERGKRGRIAVQEAAAATVTVPITTTTEA
jgi:hypothetical protein